MSDRPPEPLPDPGGGTPDRESVAAEYVLGTLTQSEFDAIQRALPNDPALADAVAAWERRLAPLMRLARAEAPPPELWARIEAQVAPSPDGAVGRAAGPLRPAGAWDRLVRWWAAGATVAAVAMAGVLLTSRPEPAAPPMATALVADRGQAAWTATALPDGSLRLAAIAPAAGTAEPPVPEGRVLQLWALPPGATGPTSLAILAPGQRSLTLAAPAVRPVPGMLIELTLEPPGGSPLPRPSGPVQFIGRLPA